jgi:cytochrome c553
MPHVRLFAALSALVSLSSGFASADDGVAFFEAKVRPVLVEHCYSCHSVTAKKSRGGLQLDTPAGIRAGGDSGTVLKDDGGASLLLQAVAYGEDAPAMPPKGKLPEKVIAELRKWVEMGAPLPVAGAKQTDAAATPAVTGGRDHWAFQPLREHAAPPVRDAGWPVSKLDRFVLARLDAEKLPHAAPADRRTLFRRLSFDLTGLPPTFEQQEAFAADLRSDAVERAVDALLSSPRFGETWGRHWLDVARYAEDHSTGESTCKPPKSPFRYRDWVISAYNADLPYPEFVRRQLAADLMTGLPPTEVTALGFLGLSPVYHKEPKLAADVIAGIVADEWDERVDAVTRGFLGLTVSCARCHDHKFDPVSQADYTALLGVMANTQLAERPLVADPAGVTAAALTEIRARVQDLDMRLGYAKEHVGTARKAGQDTAALRDKVREVTDELKEAKAAEAKLYAGPTMTAVRDAGARVNGDDPAWTVVDYTPGTYRDLPIYLRGNPSKPGDVVPRHFLTVLSKGEPKSLRTGSGRLELADAIVTDAAPLAARVTVNRVWGWLMGRGLVGTPSNFGLAGERPTHPELLDDLAARYVANGWKTKWLVREIVLSATYRQSSRADAETVSRDPDDRWLGRAPVRRLELEAWRDAMLLVSGRLDLKGGGPSDNLDDTRAARRTVYGKVSRQRPPDIHRLFDLPDPKAHGEKREPTTTPLQQLYFLNSPFVRQAAEAVVQKTVVTGRTPVEMADALYRQVLSRSATPAEAAAAIKLATPTAVAGQPAWELVAQMLLASNEFLYLD